MEMMVLSESAKRKIASLNAIVSILNLAVFAPYSLYLIFISLNTDSDAGSLFLLAIVYLSISFLAGTLTFLRQEIQQRAVAIAALVGHTCVFVSVLFQLQRNHPSVGWSDNLVTHWPAALSSVLTVSLLSIAIAIRKRVFHGRLPCSVCGYETDGLEKCPECGRSVQK
ncbi:MAG: hypothetical protein R3B67_02570 [Phycisphaerales bacterium]